MIPNVQNHKERTMIHPASFSNHQLAIRVLIEWMETIPITEEQERHGYLEYLCAEKKWRPIVIVRTIS